MSLWLSFNRSLNPNPSWALAVGGRKTLNSWCCLPLFVKLASGHPEMHPQPRPGWLFCGGSGDEFTGELADAPAPGEFLSLVCVQSIQVAYRKLSELLAD